jgi:uncharacterized protein YcnI
VIRRAFAAAAAATLALAAPASAHIQVRPATVAPGDPVQFALIVPGERDDAQTTEVTLQVPKDVLPFAWQDTPGWTRKVKLKPNQSIDTVTWTGKLAKDGFVEFQFLASTPEKGDQIVWKALQRYSDGKVVRWIGSPDSDNPAAVTKISASAPKENAGGEAAAATATAAPATTATAAPTAAAAATTSDDGSDSPLPLILSIVALALGATALANTLRKR